MVREIRRVVTQVGRKGKLNEKGGPEGTAFGGWRHSTSWLGLVLWHKKLSNYQNCIL